MKKNRTNYGAEVYSEWNKNEIASTVDSEETISANSNTGHWNYQVREEKNEIGKSYRVYGIP